MNIFHGWVIGLRTQRKKSKRWKIARKVDVADPSTLLYRMKRKVKKISMGKREEKCGNTGWRLEKNAISLQT